MKKICTCGCVLADHANVESFEQCPNHGCRGQVIEVPAVMVSTILDMLLKGYSAFEAHAAYAFDENPIIAIMLERYYEFSDLPDGFTSRSTFLDLEKGFSEEFDVNKQELMIIEKHFTLEGSIMELQEEIYQSYNDLLLWAVELPDLQN